MKTDRASFSVLIAAVALAAPLVSAAGEPVPSWMIKFIASQSSGSRTVIEEAAYKGKRVFEVLPGERAADIGNEHVLYSDEGRVICEFGGFVGKVTRGTCEIGEVQFVKTLYPNLPR